MGRSERFQAKLEQPAPVQVIVVKVGTLGYPWEGAVAAFQMQVLLQHQGTEN